MINQANTYILIFILKQIFIWSLTFKNYKLLQLTNNNTLQIITTCYPYTLQITTHYKEKPITHCKEQPITKNK